MKSFNHFILLSTAALFSSQTTHALTAEHWLNLRLNPSVLTLQREGIAQRAPDSTSTLATADLSNLPAGNGVRVRGTVTPAVTGLYTFAISGSRNATLWLSTDTSRFNKQQIAWFHEPTTVQQWTKFASQQSAAVQLQAGTAYYIEAQVMSSTAGGHFALGWKTPGATAIAVVPSAQLAAVVADPLDINDNNLPDAFESQYGLDQSTIPGALAEHADPDNDSMTNLEEYRLGANPLVKESRSDGLTFDTWQEIQGQSVSHLTSARSRFLSHPNATSHVAKIDVNNAYKIEGKNYGARYRGFIKAPVTGTCNLWITGDDDAQLWFSDGTVTDPLTGEPLTNRFGKQYLATASSSASNPDDFDLDPGQKTRDLQLTAGQTYYVEVLHKNESTSGNHVSIAWAGPGFSRTIVPSSAYYSDMPEDSDLDSDSLPDTYESSVGLSATDNGIINSKQGQFGDYDLDGLSNLLEFQLRTNPKVADTDGDGLTDSAEVNYYGTDPLVANVIATTIHNNFNLHQPAATSAPWHENTDNSITAYDRRGWIEWPVTVNSGEQGIYEIQLVASISPAALTIPFSFEIDGQVINRGSFALKTTPNTTAPFKVLTPFLPVGTHILRFRNHNVRADFPLRIHSLQLLRLGGNDTNFNGIADWAENQYYASNSLTVAPTSSQTSPAYIEGNISLRSALRLAYSTSTVTLSSLEASSAINDTFFTRLPLDANEPTNLTYSFQNGEQSETLPISWVATNILAQQQISLRVGDSLRLTAHDPASAASGTFTLQGSGSAPTVPASSQSADQPVALIFENSGTHTITATWIPAEGPPQTKTLTITVRSADFGAPFIIETYNRRTWNIPSLSGLLVEADSALYWNETTASSNTTSRSFLANAYHAGEYRTIARCPDTGNIIAVGHISAFSLSRAGSSGDSQIVEARADGSSVVRFTIVAENLPSNAEVRITMNYQGTVFPDGSRTLILRSSDFSSNGVAKVLVETSSNPPQLCHSMSAYIVD